MWLAEGEEVFGGFGEGRGVGGVRFKAVVDEFNKIGERAKAGCVGVIEAGGAEEPSLEAGGEGVGAVRGCDNG